MTQKPYFTRLENRGLIHVEGSDHLDFLQSLITNDIKRLETQPMIYACLLNAQGKFLHDFFVHQGDGFVLLDCEGGERAQDLYKRLNMYRLRSDVQISIEQNHDVFVIIGQEFGIADPRHSDMGMRSFNKPQDIDEVSLESWDKHRIALTIPDGSRDLSIGKSTMDEARMDQINAIDYDKGCYVGQELTARMHYRGLGKKHLKCIIPADVDLEKFPPAFTPIEKGGKTIGEMRSSCGDIGLALLKD